MAFVEVMDSLKDNMYELQITATDLSGNIATISHPLDVDLTPPAVSFGLVPAPAKTNVHVHLQ